MGSGADHACDRGMGRMNAYIWVEAGQAEVMANENGEL